VSGLLGVFGYSSYTPTKYAIRGLAEVLKLELDKYNIKISVAYPSDTQTSQLEREMRERPKETNLINAMSKTLTPESVAKSILYGIKKERFSIVCTFQIRLLVALNSFVLPVLRFLFLRKIKQAEGLSVKNEKH
jgi:3-dehydrosphinganine reductase